MKVGDLVLHKSFDYWGVGILVNTNSPVGAISDGHTFRIWWQPGFESVDHFYNLRLINDKNRNSDKDSC